VEVVPDKTDPDTRVRHKVRADGWDEDCVDDRERREASVTVNAPVNRTHL